MMGRQGQSDGESDLRLENPKNKHNTARDCGQVASLRRTQVSLPLSPSFPYTRRNREFISALRSLKSM